MTKTKTKVNYLLFLCHFKDRIQIYLFRFLNPCVLDAFAESMWLKFKPVRNLSCDAGFNNDKKLFSLIFALRNILTLFLKKSVEKNDFLKILQFNTYIFNFFNSNYMIKRGARRAHHMDAIMKRS